MSAGAALDPGQVAALIFLGGCKHTPEPWKGCDTCGRPRVQWTKQQAVQIVDTHWQADTVDGQTFDKRELLSLDNIPAAAREKIVQLSVATDDPRVPVVTLRVDPKHAGYVRMFKRRAARFGANGQHQGLDLIVLVFEIQSLEEADRTKPVHFARLYLHPLQGPIFSNSDIYF